MKSITFIVRWCALVINNPYLIAVLFGQVLIFISCTIGGLRSFIGFILFLVYVGGIIILIRYCVILLPSNKFTWAPLLTFVFGVLLFILYEGSIEVRGYAYGLIYRARAILLVAMLLYLVILAIVDIINYSRGMIKIC